MPVMKARVSHRKLKPHDEFIIKKNHMQNL